MSEPHAEERTLAALAHAGVLANSFNLLGIIGAALIWSTQRRQSRYVAEQALQALIYQICGLVVLLLMGLAWGGCLLLSLLPALLRPELYRTEPPLTFWLALASALLIGLVALAGVGYGLTGAWAAWNGRPFQYLGIGALLQRYQAALPPPAPPPAPRPAAPPAEQLPAAEAQAPDQQAS